MNSNLDSHKHLIGQRIREARTIRRVKQAQLARLTGLDTVTVYRIEKGLSQAQADTLRKIANELGTTVHWILNGGDDGRPVEVPEADVPPPRPRRRRITSVDESDVPMPVVQLIISDCVSKLSKPIAEDEVRFLARKFRESHRALSVPDLELELLLERVRDNLDDVERQRELERAIERQRREKHPVESAAESAAEPATHKLKLPQKGSLARGHDRRR